MSIFIKDNLSLEGKVRRSKRIQSRKEGIRRNNQKLINEMKKKQSMAEMESIKRKQPVQNIDVTMSSEDDDMIFPPLKKAKLSFVSEKEDEQSTNEETPFHSEKQDNEENYFYPVHPNENFQQYHNCPADENYDDVSKQEDLQGTKTEEQEQSDSENVSQHFEMIKQLFQYHFGGPDGSDDDLESILRPFEPVKVEDIIRKNQKEEEDKDEDEEFFLDLNQDEEYYH